MPCFLPRFIMNIKMDTTHCQNNSHWKVVPLFGEFTTSLNMSHVPCAWFVMKYVLIETLAFIMEYYWALKLILVANVYVWLVKILFYYGVSNLRLSVVPHSSLAQLHVVRMSNTIKQPKRATTKNSTQIMLPTHPNPRRQSIRQRKKKPPPCSTGNTFRHRSEETVWNFSSVKRSKLMW